MNRNDYKWKRCFDCLNRKDCACNYNLIDCLSKNLRKRDINAKPYDRRILWIEEMTEQNKW